jgi:hypothetical protein
MTKAKKRAPRKTSKQRRAIAKPIRKKVSKRASPKKVKAKGRSVAKRPVRFADRKKRAPTTVARKSLRKAPRPTVKRPIEEANIDTIDKPVPSVVQNTEYEMIQTPASDAEPAAEPDADNSKAPKQ